jgi:predicted nucleotidyltransferase
MIKNRIYGKTKNISIESLRELFKSPKLNYITLAILFGSRAKEKDIHSQSDYDIAILAEDSNSFPWGVISQAWIDIGDVLGLPDYDYDIVDLKYADRFILDNIKEAFIILKGEESEFYRLFNKNQTDS